MKLKRFKQQVAQVVDPNDITHFFYDFHLHPICVRYEREIILNRDDLPRGEFVYFVSKQRGKTPIYWASCKSTNDFKRVVRELLSIKYKYINFVYNREKEQRYDIQALT